MTRQEFNELDSRQEKEEEGVTPWWLVNIWLIVQLIGAAGRLMVAIGERMEEP